ncbi:hypothetical protein HPB50_025949 [Hyalomma asiaticum]|uniref:Uncharacterized protein n=1 Tax=Hyalomma asiaticum TaxID=266040 RepID=A0ACB7S3I2_HYAAI|nr:hypothetical protein HPB50_025949 [Hyalomma asiaticum]
MTFAEYTEADNVDICDTVSLEQTTKEALPCADATVTSKEDDDDNSTDVAVPVPTTFTDMFRHLGSIRNYICASDDAEDLLLDVAQLKQKLLLLRVKKVEKKHTIFFNWVV